MDRGFFLRNLWRWKCGLTEHVEQLNLPSIESLSKTEWSPRFEQLMRNRLIMGAYRYGMLGVKTKQQFDRVKSAKARLDLYAKTGNTEHLIDAANMCLLEFVEGVHPLKHFAATDDAIHTPLR